MVIQLGLGIVSRKSHIMRLPLLFKVLKLQWLPGTLKKGLKANVRLHPLEFEKHLHVKL